MLTSKSLVSTTLALVPQLSPENILAEPRPAGTAAALTWAALEIVRRDGPDAVMICVHADWHIRDDEAFRASLLRAAAVAVAHDSLVTVGVVPTRPDPGFGYIQPGEVVEPGDSARRVARFVEKPDRATAARMCDEGYLWNSGIFVWRAARFVEEVMQLTPEVSAALAGQPDRDTFFSKVKPISVDIGVLERSGRVMVLAGDFGWDDVGTWEALRRVLSRDADGNAVRGRASLVSARNNVVFSHDAQVVLYGVDDLVVVNCPGITLVTTVALAADLKSLLDSLPEELRNR